MKNQLLSASILRPLQLEQSAIDAWDALSATQAHLASPFLSAHYARAVEQSGMDVRVCILYRDSKMVGFFPYQFESKLSALLKSAAPAGGGMSDYFGLAADAGIRITAPELLRLAHLNHLNFSHLDESQLNYGLTGERPRTGLRIRFDTDAADRTRLESMSHKYLKDTERRERQLSRDIGPVSFEFDTQQDRLEKLRRLVAHKRAQYKKTNAKDVLATAWKLKLLENLLEKNFASCRGVLSHMTAGDTWVGSHFGVMGNGVLQYWFPVYNPDLAKYAPGRLLLHSISKATYANQVHMIDRGEGDTPSKREITNEDHLFYRGTWYNKSVSTQLARGLQSIQWRLGI
ncbi:GNAT family N-acetyltransferase [Undibacterium terreum]|uniref:Cellulose biosynthesis protein CelD n=1 Tax=Undibacterium terreum TaxID=1224302 RepID=A0A916UZN2_9BURK|nr:GNAT family N-acetyltransferase [Undibacterium terreum]GGC97060.1 cellulose biosynthesis protein CelD [Undibacterium terreum]